MVGSHHLFPLSSLPAAWVFLSLCHARVREFAHGRPQTLTHTRREKIAEKMKGGVENYGWPCSGGRRDFLQVPHFDCTPHPSFSHKNLLHFLLTTSLFQTSSKRFLPPLQKTHTRPPLFYLSLFSRVSSRCRACRRGRSH